ncbi:MAG: S-layer homology domain-containing protein [Candidatus Gracilibacteria bacterium]|nr:S-layer homology domain-containing protein [Candidatus Gracilibacteria bacterium]
MKKIIAILAFLLIFSFVAPSFAEGGFTDVPEDNPHYKSVMYLKNAGATQGYEDGTFRPNDPLNRVALLKMAFISAGVKLIPDGYIANFRDVPADAWYAPYTATARYKNILGGYQGQAFPENEVNLVEALKIVALSNGYSPDSYQHPTEWTYNENFDRNAWYVGYLKLVESMGILSAENLANSTPNDIIDRGTAADLIYAFNLQKMGGVQAQLNAVEEAIMGLMQAVQVNDMTQAAQLIGEANVVYENAKWQLPDNAVVLAAGDILHAFELTIAGSHDEAIALLNQVGDAHADMKDLTDNIAAFVGRL